MCHRTEILVNRTVGVAVVMTAMLAGLLAGCTSGMSPCGMNCSGKAPNEPGCDEDPIPIDSRAVTAPDVEGVIAIRMADPEICQDLFWARFEPTQQTTSAFEVVFKIDGEVVSVPGQKSDPNDPTQSAWTKAYQAFEGDELLAYVIPDGQDEICTPTATLYGHRRRADSYIGWM